MQLAKKTKSMNPLMKFIVELLTVRAGLHVSQHTIKKSEKKSD